MSKHNNTENNRLLFNQIEEYKKLRSSYIGEKHIIETARKDGLIKGIELAKLEVAKQLKSLGISIDIIKLSTGLSEEEIEKLS